MLKKKVVDTVEEFKIMALLYGASGTGKTFSARTLPKDRTIVISTERGELSIAGTGMTVWEVGSWEDLMEAFRDAKEEEKRDILFLDTLSEMADMCKYHIVSKLRPGIMKHRKGNPLAGVYDSAMTMEDWGEFARKMQAMIRAFRDLPKHKVMTSLETTIRDEGTGRIIYQPEVQGATGKKLLSYFDFAFRTVVDKDEEGKPLYYWLTQSGPNYNAKFRTPVGMEAPDSVEADWTKVFSLVLKGTSKRKGKKNGKPEK